MTSVYLTKRQFRSARKKISASYRQYVERKSAWIKAHPNASPEEREAALRKISMECRA